MELRKLKSDDIRKMDGAKLNETENDVRRELANIRLEQYTTNEDRSGHVRSLRRVLARVLTLKAEVARNQVKA